MNWQLQEAKNKLSEVVKRAKTEGPQTVTVRGKPEAVIMSMEEYQAGFKPDKVKENRDFVEFLLSGPRWPDEAVDLVNQRDKTPPREIEL